MVLSSFPFPLLPFLFSLPFNFSSSPSTHFPLLPLTSFIPAPPPPTFLFLSFRAPFPPSRRSPPSLTYSTFSLSKLVPIPLMRSRLALI